MHIFSTNTMRLASEGLLFTCLNPTPGTPVATGTSVPTSFTATAPLFVIKNNAPAVGVNNRVYLHAINMLHIGGTTPATVTSVQAAVVIDTGDRTPTANFSLLVPNNIVPGAKASTTQVWVSNAGNITAPAAVAARTVSRRQLKGGPTVLLDEYEMIFGSEMASAKTANGAVGTFSSSLPNVCILPQQFALVHLWFPGGATNAFSHEFELVMSER